MKWAIVSNATNEILNIYIFPVNFETGIPYGPEDITTASDVRLIEIDDSLDVGHIVE